MGVATRGCGREGGMRGEVYKLEDRLHLGSASSTVNMNCGQEFQVKFSSKKMRTHLVSE